jgi:hypothetical protein
MSGEDDQPGDGDRSDDAARRRAAGVPIPGDRDGEPARADAEGDGPSFDAPIDAEFEEPDASPLAETLGQVGVYLGVAAVGLALVGILLGLVNVRPWASIALVFSLFTAVVAMVLGAVFQASAADLSFGDE